MTDDAVTARFLWTADQLIEAQYWHRRHTFRRPFRILAWAGVAIVVLPLVAVLAIPGSPKVILAMILAAMALVAVARQFQPWLIRRQFARRHDSGMEVEWVVSSHGLTAKTPHTRSELGWPALHKVVCTPRGLMLYVSAGLFHWLPRSAFEPGGFERCAALARLHARQFHAIGPDPTTCSACGYDLRASKDKCPECGAPVPAVTPPVSKAAKA